MHNKGAREMSFNSLLVNHMKIVQVTAADKWMEPSDAVALTIPCRIMYENRLIKDYKGEEVMSAAKIFCKPEHITFDHEDKIQFDIESYAQDHSIIIVKKPQNSVHIHHAEVWVT